MLRGKGKDGLFFNFFLKRERQKSDVCNMGFLFGIC